MSFIGSMLVASQAKICTEISGYCPTYCHRFGSRLGKVHMNNHVDLLSANDYIAESATMKSNKI